MPASDYCHQCMSPAGVRGCEHKAVPRDRDLVKCKKAPFQVPSPPDPALAELAKNLRRAIERTVDEMAFDILTRESPPINLPRDPEGIAAFIRRGETPHIGCACVLCSLPQGEGWGEHELVRRVRQMGEEVGSSMRAVALVSSGARTPADE